ncbi:hypothetical protein M885DRAFT_515888 [Pelagophyceae sp. CCMP2097]|nr:hypothetical protein M885DRAFT_515888 [Pelagophyceae sp. CCMP2097]
MHSPRGDSDHAPGSGMEAAAALLGGLGPVAARDPAANPWTDTSPGGARGAPQGSPAARGRAAAPEALRPASPRGGDAGSAPKRRADEKAAASMALLGAAPPGRAAAGPPAAAPSAAPPPPRGKSVTFKRAPASSALVAAAQKVHDVEQASVAEQAKGAAAVLENAAAIVEAEAADTAAAGLANAADEVKRVGRQGAEAALLDAARDSVLDTKKKLAAAAGDVDVDGEKASSILKDAAAATVKPRETKVDAAAARLVADAAEAARAAKAEAAKAKAEVAKAAAEAAKAAAEAAAEAAEATVPPYRPRRIEWASVDAGMEHLILQCKAAKAAYRHSVDVLDNGAVDPEPRPAGVHGNAAPRTSDGGRRPASAPEQPGPMGADYEQMLHRVTEAYHHATSILAARPPPAAPQRPRVVDTHTGPCDSTEFVAFAGQGRSLGGTPL